MPIKEEINKVILLNSICNLPEVGVFTNLLVKLVGENTDHRQDLLDYFTF
jgi:hypothetical protein